jgi:hypothetical protein
MCHDISAVELVLHDFEDVGVDEAATAADFNDLALLQFVKEFIVLGDGLA